jgi:hypothetical protein
MTQKLTVILDITRDPNNGRHTGATMPLGGIKLTYPYQENQTIKSLFLKQGLNQHILKEDWDIVSKNLLIDDLLEEGVIVVIPESEPTDETDDLSIYTIKNAQKVINAQTNITQLNLWARNTKSRQLLTTIDKRIAALGRFANAV